MEEERRVRCNQCMSVFDECHIRVERDESGDREYCPVCGEEGCLMDGPFGPSIVVSMSGGCIEKVESDGDCSVLLRDYDTDGANVNDIDTDETGRNVIQWQMNERIAESAMDEIFKTVKD